MKTKYLILLLLFLLYLLKISSKNINMKFESKYPNQTAESITNMYGVANLIEMNSNGYLNKLTWFNIEGCDGVIIKGDVKYKWHPIPAITYVFVYKYMSVPEKLVGPLSYASETIGIDYIDVPKKESKHYYKTGEKLLAKVSGACASITISVITIKFVEDMISSYQNTKLDNNKLNQIFRHEYDNRILTFLCGKGIVPKIPWYPNKLEKNMITGPYHNKTLPNQCNILQK